MRGSFSILGSVVAALAFSVAVPSVADTVLIEADHSHSESGLGDFTGSITYEYDIFKGGMLTIELTNTSPDANGGYLTGFVFNINSIDPGAHALLMSTDFPLFLDTQMEDAPPFGTFDAGAALGGDWSGGGDPSGGIGVLQTGMFEFHVGAVDAPLLTAMSFITGPLAHNFLVRFRGFEDGGSDKVPGQVVPAPAALSLLAGFGLLSVSRRRHGR